MHTGLLIISATAAAAAAAAAGRWAKERDLSPSQAEGWGLILGMVRGWCLLTFEKVVILNFEYKGVGFGSGICFGFGEVRGWLLIDWVVEGKIILYFTVFCFNLRW